MGRLMIFLMTGFIWLLAAIVLDNIAYVHMVTGGGLCLLIQWINDK